MESQGGESGYVGRLAPSPTGALHLGNVRTFMIAWLRARTRGGKVILRIEDLDHPRDKPGAAADAVEDLRWLGFNWDETFVQSERKPIYREALAELKRLGLVYPCVCSRRDVEAAQSAPHLGDQLFYSGKCRGLFPSWREAAKAIAPRTPCWRFRVERCVTVAFEDAFAGYQSYDVARTLGDFPIARDEGGAGYTLAVVVDDLLMGVTEVVRGDDLIAATPAQILITQALLPWVKEILPSATKPKYCHVPLVVGPDGKRLAKRHGDTRIASFRECGISPEAIIGSLASSCGWCNAGETTTLEELRERLSEGSLTFKTIPKTPIVPILPQGGVLAT